MKPPILTNRQKEILELLVAGATRNEIASHLKISPETVKIHTKNIVDKFDAQNLRDAFDEISKYLSAHGDNGSGYRTFLEHVCHKVILRPDLVSAEFSRISKGFVVNGPLLHHIYSLGNTDEENLNVRINDDDAGKPQVSGTYNIYQFPISPPLENSETFERKIEYLVRSKTNQKMYQVSNTVGTPIEKLELEIIFPNHIPKNIKGTVFRGGVFATNLNNHPNATVTITETKYHAIIMNPISEQRYTIDWDFDA